MAAATARPFNGKTNFYADALGKSFVNYEAEPILIVGTAKWTRADLARELGCVHLAAARRLSKALESVGIDSMRKLHKTAPQDLITIPGVGNIQLFVAMCALDAEGFNVEEWYGWDDDTVTATTLQNRARREKEKEKEGRKQERKAKRLALAG